MSPDKTWIPMGGIPAIGPNFNHRIVPDQEVLPFPDREPEKTAILKINTKLFNKVNN